MKKQYLKLNIFCLVLSGCFLVGAFWVWWPLTKDLKIKRLEDYTTQETNNKQQIADNSVDIKALKHESIKTVEKLDNKITSNTIEQVIIKEALLKEFILNVPFTSQAPEKNWEQPWQDACEEAVLLMFDAYYKNYNLSPLFAKDEILKMVNLETTKGWGYDIDAEQIKSLGSEFLHLNLKIVENPTIEMIKEFIVNKKPVYVVASGKDLPNPHFQNGGPDYHTVVIKGYDEENFITNDPGTQFGQSFKYKYQDLMNAIHDWNGGDVKNGRRVVLVVE